MLGPQLRKTSRADRQVRLDRDLGLKFMDINGNEDRCSSHNSSPYKMPHSLRSVSLSPWLSKDNTFFVFTFTFTRNLSSKRKIQLTKRYLWSLPRRWRYYNETLRCHITIHNKHTEGEPAIQKNHMLTLSKGISYWRHGSSSSILLT